MTRLDANPREACRPTAGAPLARADLDRRKERAVVVSVGASMAAIAVLDLSTPLGVATPTLYAFPIVLAFRSGHERTVWIAAAAATFLTILGFSQSPDSGDVNRVIANRVISLSIIWVLAVLVTLMKRTRNLRRAAEDRSSRIISAMMDAIITIDASGAIVDWNPQAEVIFGWSRAEASGRNIATLIIPEDYRVAHLQALDRLRAGAQSKTLGQRLELSGIRKDGTHFPVELTITEIKKDLKVHYTGCIRDITQRVVAEESLERYAANLERSNAELDRFAYAASHDLKAPLRAIDSLATWVEEDSAGELSEASRQDLALMRSRIERMHRLLDDLLEYSRVGRSKAVAETFELSELVVKTVELLDPPSGFEIVIGELPRMTGGRPLLEQVLRNLIGNSIKHNKRAKGRIEITAERIDRGVAITVADDGPGIPEEFHARIFDLFRTLKPRDQVEGSGLGLSLIKKIIDIEGGDISVDSAPGKGARFRFTWPIDAVFEGDAHV